MVGIVTFVILSELERPESLAAGRTGVPVLTGAMVSMVTTTEAEDADVLPATSVVLIVIVFEPSASVEEVTA